MVSEYAFGLTSVARYMISVALAAQTVAAPAAVTQQSVSDSLSVVPVVSERLVNSAVYTEEKTEESEPVVNDSELEKLAETAKFVSIPDTVKIKDKNYTVTTSLVTKYLPDDVYGEAERLSQFFNSKKTVKEGIVTDGDNMFVTVPQHMVVSEDDTCPYLGEKLLIKTKSGRLITARIGGLFDASEEKTDTSKSVYVTCEDDKAICLKVWSEKDAKNPFANDPVVEIANLGFDEMWRSFEPTSEVLGDTTTTAEDYVGRWGVAKDLKAANWVYKKDVVLGNNGDSAEKVEALGIAVGDIVVNGTNDDSPTRVYMGADEDGNARWQRADKEGHIWDIEDWDGDSARRSVWQTNKTVTYANNAGAAGYGGVTTNGNVSAGTQRFIDSCKKESDDWASGANFSQPWKYIDYWDQNVPEEYNPHSWGGQCSEYILWNLMNIGLVPGKTMADWDKIQWGGRAELKFLQDHPEYGEIHALDGNEEGAIPGYYVPRPGDIAIHNHGDHFEMVSEVYEDHWEGYSSGSEGCGPVSHPINSDTNADNHDGYYVFLTVYFDKALADS